MHCLYHVPHFVGKYGKFVLFRGQGIEKMNDEIKSIHQKRSNKFGKTHDDLTVRKRMEFLIENDYEGQQNKYSETEKTYWIDGISNKFDVKRRRIEAEISEARETFQMQQKENEPPLENMTINELK